MVLRGVARGKPANITQQQLLGLHKTLSVGFISKESWELRVGCKSPKVIHVTLLIPHLQVIFLNLFKAVLREPLH